MKNWLQSCLVRRMIPHASSRRPDRAGFSLVEVTLALGLVSYALLALLGLFTVALSSSRDSTLETALSQITLHVSSLSRGTAGAQTNYYTHAGSHLPQGGPETYFQVVVTSTASDASTIADTSDNLRLVHLTISSPVDPGVSQIVQTSTFVP